MHLVASDAGRLDRPHPIDELILVSGERAEILIAVDEPDTHRLVTRTVDRGGMGMMGGGMGRRMGNGTGANGATTEIATVEVTGDSTVSL